MTREQVIKHWNEIQAFKDGKEIEMRRNGEEWKLNRNPMFANDFEYRIKPEPELIPFDFSDAEFLIGKAIKAKDNSCINIITKVSRSRGIVLVSQSYYFEDLLKHYTFLDGAACGKIKQ